MDYQFVGAQFGRQGRGGLLRVYIDAQQGIDVEDCARVSEQLSAVLDVEDLIQGAYVLEVSSPGFDRPLFAESDFAARVGEVIRVRLARPVQGRRNFKGELLELRPPRTIVVRVDGQDWELDLGDVDEARLAPADQARR